MFNFFFSLLIVPISISSFLVDTRSIGLCSAEYNHFSNKNAIHIVANWLKLLSNERATSVFFSLFSLFSQFMLNFLRFFFISLIRLHGRLSKHVFCIIIQFIFPFKKEENISKRCSFCCVYVFNWDASFILSLI